MTYIFKKTSYGRGGFIHAEFCDKASGGKWMHGVGLDDAAECSQIFKGKNAPLNLDIVPRTMIVEKKVEFSGYVVGTRWAVDHQFGFKRFHRST